MDKATALRLNDINAAFYRGNSAAFSASRHGFWPGWQRVLDAARDQGALEAGGHVRVFDLACGNLRFEDCALRFAPDVRFAFHCVDNCAELTCGKDARLDAAQVTYYQIDAVKMLLDESLGGQTGIETGAATAHPEMLRGTAAAQGEKRRPGIAATLSKACREVSATQVKTHDDTADAAAKRIAPREKRTDPALPLSALRDIPPCDLCVSFGFLHHVPTFEARAAALRFLLSAARPGGIVAVSLWRFMDDAGLAEKAHATHAEALDELDLPLLDEGDYLLGWQGRSGAWRYCHHFDDAEIDALVNEVCACVPNASEIQLRVCARNGASPACQDLHPCAESSTQRRPEEATAKPCIAHSRKARQNPQLIERFQSDGRTGALNTYLIFRA